MSTIWRKAIRDFWRERARTVLVVLAIALGISAFAAVMSSYTILTRELDLGYLATNPASAVMRLDSIDDDTVKAILQNPEVSDAEPRRTIGGQMKAGPVQWRNLMLFVVHDYGNIRVSKLVPEEGAWPPAAGEILIERDAFQVAKAKIGDVVRVKTANGVEQPLVITGSAHDVGQAQARMENIVYGYIKKQDAGHFHISYHTPDVVFVEAVLSDEDVELIQRRFFSELDQCGEVSTNRPKLDIPNRSECGCLPGAGMSMRRT